MEERLSFKKTLLLYDWIRGNKNVKTIEQEYNLYRGAIYRLGEGFSWLADSLAAIAENAGWKKGRKEDLNRIKLLSNRLIEGVEEEGLNLANLYIPGLGRSYIGGLVEACYYDEEFLKEASEGELAKVVPERLARRIKRRFSGETCKVKERGLQDDSRRLTTISSRTSQLKTENQELKAVLQIDTHRPDRIIFMGKKIEVTSTEFSLIHLLAQNRGKILTHNDFLDTIWKEDVEATYVQITYHLYEIRRVILKTIGNNKKNRKKVKDIFKVVSRRGIMLNLEEDKLKIN